MSTTDASAARAAGVEEGERALLRAQDLRRDFGGVRAVDNATFDIREGVITSLIGPNGAGKSTVVGLLGGALRPTSGSVVFDGDDITRLSPHLRAERGLIRTYQLSSEFSKLTVVENLLVAAPRQRGERFSTLVFGKRSWRDEEVVLLDRAHLLLERFSMIDHRNEYAGNLSGGQKRLVEIMRSLMARPKLLLLDEPMAGVNPTLARTIEGYLTDLSREGLTMVLVEHELDVVERLSATVVVMAEGNVIATGTMADLRRNEEVIRAYLAG